MRITQKDIYHLNAEAKEFFTGRYPQIGRRYGYYAIDIFNRHNTGCALFGTGLKAKEACQLMGAMVKGAILKTKELKGEKI